MKEKEFKIHAYGKSELAMLYFPGDNKELALKKLRCWTGNFAMPAQASTFVINTGSADNGGSDNQGRCYSDRESCQIVLLPCVMLAAVKKPRHPPFRFDIGLAVVCRLISNDCR